jgi:hypothetical protein
MRGHRHGVTNATRISLSRDRGATVSAEHRRDRSGSDRGSPVRSGEAFDEVIPVRRFLFALALPFAIVSLTVPICATVVLLCVPAAIIGGVVSISSPERAAPQHAPLRRLASLDRNAK